MAFALQDERLRKAVLYLRLTLTFYVKMRIEITRVCVAAAMVAGSVFGTRQAQAQNASGSYTYQQVTTLESVVAGGFGRSKVLFTPAFKGMADAPLENLFSLTGINMSNVLKNEETISRLMQTMNDEGFTLVQAVPLTSSIQGGGIFMTRYIFRKAK